MLFRSATCVRLADDAMGAVEGSQRKLEELAKRTEESLDRLRMDVTGVRAELAGSARPSEAMPATASGALVDVLEQRIAPRLGHQILELSNILKRVMQAQAALQWQCVTQGGGQLGGTAATTASSSAPPVVQQFDVAVGTCAVDGEATSEVRRRAAIDELYRELRQLEASS